MKYMEAELDIIAFDAEDVITTSLTDGGEGSGNEDDFGDLFG
jgi:hypothetical protein